MTHPANAANASSVSCKIFFASIVVAVVLAPVITVGRQDSTTPQIKKRILRVDRVRTEESAKTKRAETQRPTQETTAEASVATASHNGRKWRDQERRDPHLLRAVRHSYVAGRKVNFSRPEIRRSFSLFGFGATQNGTVAKLKMIVSRIAVRRLLEEIPLIRVDHDPTSVSSCVRV